MAEPYIGEIRLFSFNYAPKGWAFCDGQLMSIQQNAALFATIGTFYGGDGIRTFGLPNLQGRVAIHQSNTLTIGEVGGEYTHTLTANELPPHSHSLVVGAEAVTNDPSGKLFGAPNVNARIGTLYSGSAGASASVQAITPAGDSEPHDNVQPSLVMNYSIALTGLFPTRP